MGVKVKLIEGKTCASCGRNKRRADNRACVFCEFWDACKILEGAKPANSRQRERAWQTWRDLAKDYRTRENGRRGRNLRRGRLLAAEGHFTIDQTRAILRAQEGHCAYCEATGNLHLDHCNPLSRGGSNWPWNLQWLCAAHNLAKSARTDAEYRELAGLPVAEPISLQLWRHFFRVSLFPILG